MSIKRWTGEMGKNARGSVGYRENGPREVRHAMVSPDGTVHVIGYARHSLFAVRHGSTVEALERAGWLHVSDGLIFTASPVRASAMSAVWDIILLADSGGHAGLATTLRRELDDALAYYGEA